MTDPYELPEVESSATKQEQVARITFREFKRFRGLRRNIENLAPTIVARIDATLQEAEKIEEENAALRDALQLAREQAECLHRGIVTMLTEKS